MNKLLYQTSQCQCEQDCCKSNEYSFGSLNPSLNKAAMSTQYLPEVKKKRKKYVKVNERLLLTGKNYIRIS